jgi:N-acetylated-alpha-linked acidic dipeptidase
VNELEDKNRSILSKRAGSRSEAATQSKDLVSRLDLADVILDLIRVEKEINAFEAAGKKLNESLKTKLAAGPIDPKLALTLNHGMMQVERNWLNPDGIPGRPWFKHILYGARFTYAHLELPGLTEAVEAQDWSTAKQQAEILERALEKNTNLLNELNSTLNP